jgi:hypothetical protein
MEDIVRETFWAETPVNTGYLRDNIEVQVTADETGATIEAYNDTYYNVFVTDGTVPHDIYPSFARALYWPGADHPVAYVFHPGTEPNPYHLRAAELIADQAGEALASRVLDHIDVSAF